MILSTRGDNSLTHKQGDPQVTTWLASDDADQKPPCTDKPSHRGSEASTSSGPSSTGASYGDNESDDAISDLPVLDYSLAPFDSSVSVTPARPTLLEIEDKLCKMIDEVDEEFQDMFRKTAVLLHMVYNTPTTVNNAGNDQKVETEAPAATQPVASPAVQSTEEELAAQFKALGYIPSKASSTQANTSVDGDELLEGDSTEDRLLRYAELIKAEDLGWIKQAELREAAEAKTTLP